MDNKYLINFEEIENNTLSELSSILKKRNKPLNELLLKDFVFYEGKEIFPGNGLYIFYDNKENRFAYVGKCSVRTFAERIPSHFDLRAGGWFNSMIKSVLKGKGEKEGKKRNEIEITNEMVINQAKLCFSDFSIALINFSNPDDNEKIAKLESILRKGLEPEPYNATKKRLESKEIINKLIEN